MPVNKDAELLFENQELKDRVAGLEMLITQKDIKIRDMIEKVKELRELVQKATNREQKKAGG